MAKAHSWHVQPVPDIVPSPVKPRVHVQVNAPMVFVHVARSGTQLSVCAAHSSTSTQPAPVVTPSPVKPALHAQVNPPMVFVQVAAPATQLSVCEVFPFPPVRSP